MRDQNGNTVREKKSRTFNYSSAYFPKRSMN